MISEHSDAEDEGVYGNPKQAIKLLQTAQSALGKIKQCKVNKMIFIFREVL